jgi:hypothetical protein
MAAAAAVMEMWGIPQEQEVPAAVVPAVFMVCQVRRQALQVRTVSAVVVVVREPTPQYLHPAAAAPSS